VVDEMPADLRHDAAVVRRDLAPLQGDVERQKPDEQRRRDRAIATGRSGDQYTITERATSPVFMASNASLT
jgi:hypothetical protein